ncbi:MAG: hypothetical protein Q4E57_10795, partial [Eubacteriales bacterium]|nr:hypothetical protein [Eubacteriales bacterium]
MKSNKFIALALTAVLGASTVLSYVPSGAALYSYAAMGSAASGRNVATATDMAGAGAASGASSASGNAAAAGASPRAASASAAATATPTDLPLNNAVATATDMSSNDALANTKVTSKGVPGLSSLFTYRTDEEIEAEVAALTKYQRYESYTALVVVKDVELGELEAGSTVTLTVNDDAGSAFAATLTTEELLEAMGVDPDDTARIAKIRTAEELIKLSGEVLFTDDTDRVSIISVTNKAYSVKSLLKVLLSDPRVVSADPDYTVKVETTPITSAPTSDKTGEDGKTYIIADYYNNVTSSQYAYSTSAAN